MRLLLDEGLPRSLGQVLSRFDLNAVHVADVGLLGAPDVQILEMAGSENLVIVTLDADFHMLLATRSSTKPSVIRIREEGFKADDHAKLLDRVVHALRPELEAGVVVSARTDSCRYRRLPL